MNHSAISMKQVVDEIDTYLENTEKHYEVIQKNSNRIYKRTTRIIKSVFFLTGILLMINIYFVYNFGTGIISMASNMNEMYAYFGKMSHEVHEITESVQKMTVHIGVLENMNESMFSMNNTMTDINGNVESMQGEIRVISEDVSFIHGHITDIGSRLDEVNGNMYDVGDNVHEMSRTIPK